MVDVFFPSPSTVKEVLESRNMFCLAIFYDLKRVNCLAANGIGYVGVDYVLKVWGVEWR